MWILFVVLATGLSVANLIMSIMGNVTLRGWLTVGALSFTAFEAWAQYYSVLQFVYNSNYQAVAETMPSMNGMLLCFIIIMVALNIAANIIYRGKLASEFIITKKEDKV